MPEESKAENLSPEMAGATRSAETARALIRKAKRATRRRFPTEDKIRIVMEGPHRLHAARTGAFPLPMRNNQTSIERSF